MACRSLSLLFSLLFSSTLLAAPTSGPAKTEVSKNDKGFVLLRDGKPYFIKGAGGDGDKKLLADSGANSFRTWGADNLDAKLEEAQKLGLTVTVGMWLKHEGDGGFNYTNAKAVADQKERCRKAIEKYKNDPAVLMWAVGNEMEGYKAGDNPAIWAAVEDIAKLCKELDPNHPTMTVIAEIGGARVKSINDLCPDIDIIGINSYGGVSSIGERYKKLSPTKPYIITEFGPAGTWEGYKTKYGAAVELSSTKKGESYRNGYLKGVLAEDGLCLGSYAFTWGFKQEATATWYGMFLADGTQTESIHTMAELWSGKAPENRCPQLTSPKVESDEVAPGQTVNATIKLSDPDNDPLTVKWMLVEESKHESQAGETQPTPPSHPEAILSSDKHGAKIKMPAQPGIYRLFVYANDGKGNSAVANTPLHISANATPVKD